MKPAVSDRSAGRQLPRPKDVILRVLLATTGQPMAAQALVGACTLMGVSDNSARTALVRLRNAGLIQHIDRGQYQLGPAATTLADDVARWRSGEARVRPWSGGWIIVHTGALPRSDRTVVRQRERALQLLGLRELESGLTLRPDNLSDSLDSIRDRLYRLGLDPAAAVFTTSTLDASRTQAAPGLWRRRQLELGYRQQIETLGQWMDGWQDKPLDQAAREAFELGDQAIRQLVFDPLLPDTLINTQLRAEFTDVALRFDRLGQAIWKQRAHQPEALDHG